MLLLIYQLTFWFIRFYYIFKYLHKIYYKQGHNHLIKMAELNFDS